MIPHQVQQRQVAQQAATAPPGCAREMAGPPAPPADARVGFSNASGRAWRGRNRLIAIRRDCRDTITASYPHTSPSACATPIQINQTPRAASSSTQISATLVRSAFLVGWGRKRAPDAQHRPGRRDLHAIQPLVDGLPPHQPP